MQIYELVIIATKVSGVAVAAQTANHIADENTLILTIQNGLGAGDQIRAASDHPNILLGVAAGFDASVKVPGHVRMLYQTVIGTAATAIINCRGKQGWVQLIIGAMQV